MQNAQFTTDFDSKIASRKPYNFGFILSTSLGNLTRYLNFRKYAERDPDVNFVWAPVKHYIAPGEPDPFRWLPRPLYTRAVVFYQSYPVLRRMRHLDAVMIHMFEAHILAGLRKLLFSHPLIVSSNDNAPVTNRSTHPLYPRELNKPTWRQKLRLAIDLWRERQSDLFIPFSSWVGGVLVNDCGISRENVHAIHVGLDLDIWQPVSRVQPQPGARAKVLFVGGEFVRKGGELLLQVYREHFSDRVELHLVTKEPPLDLPPNVHLYTDIGPNDKRLTQLYAEADMLVLPTTAELSPWVLLEAMASSCPVISTDVGGIPDIVRSGETGLLIPKNDRQALTAAIQQLLDSPEQRYAMGQRGRAMIERDFNAAVNVPRILQIMKDAVDKQRVPTGNRGLLSTYGRRSEVG